jgi:hypothetical protein
LAEDKYEEIAENHKTIDTIIHKKYSDRLSFSGMKI